MPMGPLRLLDEIGLDVAGTCGQRIEVQASPGLATPPSLLKQMNHKGMLGRKTGSGFYLYSKKKGKLPINPRTLQTADKPHPKVQD
jgi:3-hydroxyacyl-CoA dehydrogenase